MRSRLDGLFPPGVSAEVRQIQFGPGSADVHQPTDRGASGSRRDAEFAAGRACAQAAIARRGIQAFSVGMLRDGAPSWPDGLVGSISHSGGFAAAAVARRNDFEGLGVDLARIRALDPSLAPHFARAAELRWLASLAPSKRPFWTFFLFAAKESFQKCARPVLGHLPAPYTIEIRVEAANWSLRADVDQATELSWRGKCGMEGAYLLAATIAGKPG